MDALQMELINLLIVVLTACVGLVTRYFTKYLKQKGVITILENNKEVVKTVVHATEQLHKQLNGEEKLNLAKMEIINLMQEKNIKISEKEINIFIESAVKEMNKAINEELKK